STLRRTNGTPPVTALTTNGISLDRRVDGLVEAGLNRVNISLDTVDRERFATISRRDRLADVVAGIDAALAAGLSIKINAVPQIDSYRR
ncbi:radical SAM protein, partial [Xanthomonas citri pv. citri]|nr:radical SAM protein [Xanthomonas citri pv. citri]